MLGEWPLLGDAETHINITEALDKHISNNNFTPYNIFNTMETKKNYKKLQHIGNENGWHEPAVSLGVTSITEAQAEELNSHYPSTGTKYEETDEKPYGEAPLEVPVDKPKDADKPKVVKTAKVAKVVAQKVAQKVAKQAAHKADETPEVKSPETV